MILLLLCCDQKSKMLRFQGHNCTKGHTMKTHLCQQAYSVIALHTNHVIDLSPRCDSDKQTAQTIIAIRDLYDINDTQSYCMHSERKLLDFSYFQIKINFPVRYITIKKNQKKIEYLPRNLDISSFHRKLNFTLIYSTLVQM